MIVELGLSLSGTFVAEKRTSSGALVERLTSENLVLDAGWDSFKSRAFYTTEAEGIPRYLYLGSSSQEPSPTDPGLLSVSGTLPGKRSVDQGRHGGNFDPNNATTPEIVSTCTLAFEYGEGEAEGVWSELGLAYDSTYTEPYNRSLFRDQNGNPVTLTVLSDEFLTVYVELRLYWPVGEFASGVFNFNGSPVNWSAVILSAVVAEDFGGFNSSFNAWQQGLPSNAARKVGTSNTIDGVTDSVDSVNLSATSSVSLDPGSYSETDGFTLHPGITTKNIEFIEITFGSPVVKQDTEKLTGQVTWSFSRANPPPHA